MAKYVLFDSETTGLEDEDRILQIGGMVVSGKGDVETFCSLCDPKTPIKLQAMETHGITPEMIEGTSAYSETPFRKRLDELNTEDNYLIAHNIKFDLAMIAKEGFTPNMKLVDTYRAAMHLIEDVESHRLQHLRYALGLYKNEEKEAAKHGIELKAHDALSDVLFMKLLLSKILKKAKEKYPNENPMEKLVELTRTPVLLKTFKFGKHKDKSIAEICQTDKGYIRWMKGNMDLDEDMLYTLDVYEGRVLH